MTLDRARIARILAESRGRRHGVLLEPEGMALLEALGVAVPQRVEIATAAAAAHWKASPLPGERVVLKAVAPHLVHKTEAQAIAVLPNHPESIAVAAEAMARRLACQELAGFAVFEFVPHERSLGHELLVGLRWTAAFGPVVTVGAGGIHAELLTNALQEEEGLAVFSPGATDAEALARSLSALAPVRLITERQRGRPPAVTLAALIRVVRAFLALAEEFCPDPIAEFEVNPLVVSGGRLVALDALLKLGEPKPAAPAPRPLEKLQRLLEPRSIAVMGVSEKMNPGRIILQNILRAGFDRTRVAVVKPGIDAIDGCRCYPAVAALPQAVDLFIASVSAAQAADAISTLADTERAESAILIPGGLEEKPGAEPIVERMRQALARSRATHGKGPVINGGNCLGIRSVPGRYDTLFIPDYKLSLPQGEPNPVALITGSGAFAVSKLSKLAGVNPRYVITVGNQMDLTLADYLEYLEDDPEVEVFAVYLEGFRPRDGSRFLRCAQRITAAGRSVILYVAGRTQAGAAAAASHTAAVGGDHRVTRQLARDAGAIVAESLEDFEDLVRTFARLRGRPVAGLRLAAASNAGYECVTIADHLCGLELAPFAQSTLAGLRGVIDRARLGEIVSIRNPLDLTPTMGDGDFEEVVRLMLADPYVDVAVVGCVPLTGMLATLPPGRGHREDLGAEGSIAQRLVRLHRNSTKPWVAVVDAGRLYDPMAQLLEDGGVATFRTADRALKILHTYCADRLKHRGGEAAWEPAFLKAERVHA